MIRRVGMRAQVKEGNVRALFSEDSVEMGHYDGTRAEGVIGHAFQAQPRRPRDALIQDYHYLLGSDAFKGLFP